MGLDYDARTSGEQTKLLLVAKEGSLSFGIQWLWDLGVRYLLVVWVEGLGFRVWGV